MNRVSAALPVAEASRIGLEEALRTKCMFGLLTRVEAQRSASIIVIADNPAIGFLNELLFAKTIMLLGLVARLGTSH